MFASSDLIRNWPPQFTKCQLCTSKADVLTVGKTGHAVTQVQLELRGQRADEASCRDLCWAIPGQGEPTSLYVHRRVQGRRIGAARTTEWSVGGRVCVMSVRNPWWKAHTFFHGVGLRSVRLSASAGDYNFKMFRNYSQAAWLFGDDQDDLLLYTEEVKTKAWQFSLSSCSGFG